MINKNDLKDLVVSNLEDNQFLIDLTISSSNQINVFIDSMEGFPISECIKFTKLIEAEFDRDVEDYELSVSSGGLDLSFTIDQQFEKNLNKEVELVAKDGLKYEGILLSYTKDTFSIEIETKELLEGKKRKSLVKKELTFDRLEDVKTIKPLVNFKKNKKSKKK